MIILLVILSIILIGGAFCAVFKAGENDGIAKYNYLEDLTK